MAELGYDYEIEQNYDPKADFGLIPEGDYEAIITASDVKTTKNGDGRYAWLEWTIVGPSMAGRKVWQNIMMNHPNEKTVEIGRKQMSSLLHACGMFKASDTTQFHDIPCLIKIKIQKGKDGYEDSNTVARTMRLHGDDGDQEQQAPAPSRAPAPAPAQPQRQTLSNRPAWKK